MAVAAPFLYSVKPSARRQSRRKRPSSSSTKHLSFLIPTPLSRLVTSAQLLKMAEVVSNTMEVMQGHDSTLITRYNETIGQMQALLKALKENDHQEASVTRAKSNVAATRASYDHALQKVSKVREKQGGRLGACSSIRSDPSVQLLAHKSTAPSSLFVQASESGASDSQMKHLSDNVHSTRLAHENALQVCVFATAPRGRAPVNGPPPLTIFLPVHRRSKWRRSALPASPQMSETGS